MISSDGADSAWPEPTQETRPWTRWWWFGSAVDEAGLVEALERFAAIGLGGVEIQSIYAARDGHANRPFLSPQWVQALEITIRHASRLGLGVDLTTGSGWPFGGPWVTPEDATQRVEFERVEGRVVAVGVPHGMQVKRATPGSEGPVIDYFSPTALDHYLAPFDAALAGHAAGLRAQFHDSYEVERGDWTPTLAADFRRLRGYDLTPHVAAWSGEGDPDTVARVRCDVSQTFADLLLERFTARWSDWSHERGWLSRNQAHGSPGNLLDLYARVDIPETEEFGPTGFAVPGLRTDPDYPVHRSGRPDPLVMRFASSAAHLNRRRLVGSETLTWLAEHLHGSLAMAKPEIDQLLTAGINHTVFHGSPYSPAEADWPGNLFYASTNLTPHDPTYRDLPDLVAYLTRAQSVLQSGRHGNDVAVYFPIHDLWQAPGAEAVPQFTVHGEEWVRAHPTGFGDVAAALQDRGWQFDYVSDALLPRLATDPAYAAVVVPGAELMPETTLESLREVARSGTTVIFVDHLPADVPGLAELERRRRRLAELLGGSAWTVVAAAGLDAALVAAGAVAEPAATPDVRVIRRRHDDGTSLMLANLGADLVDGWVGLGDPSGSVVALDALDGRTGALDVRAVDGRTEVDLRLEPGQSIFLRTGVEGAEPYDLRRPTAETVAIEGPWTLEFLDGGPELPPTVTLDALGSWTDLGPAYADFSGRARYTTTFEAPGDGSWLLDLGTVAEAAVVALNEMPLGTAWSLPYRLAVGGALRPGTNTLEVEVVNLGANRLAAVSRAGVDWQRFFFVDITYGEFDATGWDPMPSGLLGPIHLRRLT